MNGSASARRAARLCPPGGIDDPGQCSALLALLTSSGWRAELPGADVALHVSSCAWPGVTCGGGSGREVLSVAWRGGRGGGSLPAAFLAGLPSLRSLDLSASGLSGAFPSLDFRSALTSLTLLNLSHNARLGGVIPASLWQPLAARGGGVIDISDTQLVLETAAS